MSSPTDPPPSPIAARGPMPFPGLTIGQLIDRTFRLLRAQWRLFIGIAVVPGAAIIAIYLLAFAILLVSDPAIRRVFHTILLLLTVHGPIPTADNQPPTAFYPHPTVWIWAPMLILYFATLPLFALYAAASASAVVRANVGAAVTAAQAWGVARKRAGRYTWLLLLFGLIVFGPNYLFMGAFAGVGAVLSWHAAPGSPPPYAFLATIPLIVLLFIGSYVYSAIMFLRYSVVFAVSVFEDLPASASLRRSAVLTRGAKGRIFVVLLVVYLVTAVLITACEFVLFVTLFVGVLVASSTHFTIHSPPVLFLLLPLGLLLGLLILLAVITLPYAAYSTALGALYCDQYFRLNGVLPVIPPAEGVLAAQIGGGPL